MMKKLYFHALLSLALLGACERPFELKDGNLPERLYLECLAGDGDTTFVSVQTCIPVNSGKAVETLKTEIERLDFSAGGVPVTLSRYKPGISRLNRWYTCDPIQEGKNIRVEARAKGMDPVSGESYIPAAPAVKDISMQVYQKDSSWLEVNIEMEGERPSDAYYGIVCLIRQEYEQLSIGIDTFSLVNNYSQGISETVDDDLLSSAEDNFFDFSFDGKSMIDDYSFGSDYFPGFGSEDIMQVYVPKKSYLEKNGHRMHFFVPRDYSDTLQYHQPAVFNEFWGFITTPEHDVIERSRYYYGFKIYRLSPDFFHFAQSRWMQRNNVLSFIGLAPSISAWSNVEGGFGVVAGLRSTVTPMVESRKDGIH